MDDASALPFADRDVGRPQPVDIIAPDRYCTTLLLEQAARFFPAEVVYSTEFEYSSAWIVRLNPPSERDWAIELLALVERWLESCRLPCAKVLYGGRSYLFRASTDGAWFQAAAESSRALPVLYRCLVTVAAWEPNCTCRMCPRPQRQRGAGNN
jgi:hypothetical protein